MLSAFVVGYILFYANWQAVFILVMILFVIFVVFLLSLNIDEKVEEAIEHKQNGEKVKIAFLCKPVILMAMALFCIVYTEQIMNYYNRPHLHFDLGFNMKDVGLLVAVYNYCSITW